MTFYTHSVCYRLLSFLITSKIPQNGYCAICQPARYLIYQNVLNNCTVGNQTSAVPFPADSKYHQTVNYVVFGYRKYQANYQ